MSPKENFLEAVRFGRPEYVPLGNEPIWTSFQLEGNFRVADWTDLWGVRWEVGVEGTVPFPKGNPLPSLDRLADYRFPNPGNLVLTDALRARIAAADRRHTLLRGELTYFLFERAWAIMGMENFLTALITHPAESHALLHAIAQFARGVFDRYLELGVDAIGFSEDLGTQRALALSPAMFREFLLPEYVYCFENALKAGVILDFHSCGCVEAIAGDLAAIGVTILNPIQRRANNLAELKASTVGRTALKGGIDTAVLAQGTPDDVRREVRSVMEVLKPGGGY
ncbi:MAG: uroporphyrinogen decarboxylase family protein, partial [Armatimonadota bacterium]|nr:uroporphyrinogen decarboxylase family protein [Armatimonadota bacterium]